jgi:hypothetical protein
MRPLLACGEPEMTGFRTDWLNMSGVTRAIADMEWEDQDPSAERALLEHYKQCLERGELWEPPF